MTKAQSQILDGFINGFTLPLDYSKTDKTFDSEKAAYIWGHEHLATYLQMLDIKANEMNPIMYINTYIDRMSGFIIDYDVLYKNKVNKSFVYKCYSKALRIAYDLKQALEGAS